MASKTSDDPMDLGGFMQNFVLSNPFKDMPGISNSKDLIKSDSEEKSPLGNPSGVGNSTSPQNSGGSSPGSNHSNKSKEELVLADDNGQVLDTPKAHVGSNVVFAAALKQQKVSGVHAKVQKWLKNNYMHEPSHLMCKDSKELAADVQEQFPHITNMTLSKIMTFTFPNCAKITNISGFHGYKGLVGKPQPEDYCNLDLLKAVSHCKLYGSITEASQLYNVPVSSVASLHYWHPDLANLPVDMSVADELKTDPSAFTIPGTGQDEVHSHSTRRSKRRTLPVDYCDPDNLTDLEEDRLSGGRLCHRTSPSLTENKLIMNLKEEVEDSFDGENEASLTNAMQLTDENEAAYSLLRNLLKKPRLTREDNVLIPEHSDKDIDGESPVDCRVDVIVKSEPVDPAYGDGCSPVLSTSHVEKPSRSNEPIRRKRKQSVEKIKALHGSEVDRLRSEVQRLKGKMNIQLAKNQKQEIQLLLSQKEVLNIKSSLCSHQVTFTELSQDFSNLQEQFCVLQRKFKRSMDQLERDKAEVVPAKKKSNRHCSVNSSAS